MFLFQIEAVRLLLRGLIIGALAALMAFGLSFAGALSPLERGGSSELFRLRGPRAPRSRIALLVLDDESVRRAGRSPIPRRFYAQTVRALRAQGARVIAFNFSFATPSDDPKQDAELARVFSAGSEVICGAVFDPQGSVTDPLTLQHLPAFAVADRGGGARIARTLETSIPTIFEAQAGLGHVNFHPEPGGEVRRLRHLIRFGGQLYPSLALEAAIRSRGENAANWVASPGQILSPDGRISVPIDENGAALINWLGGDGTFPQFSMAQLLDGRVPPGALRGATVLVGSSRAYGYTPIDTPFSPALYNNQSGLHLQANAYDDIVSGRALRLVSAPWQLAITLLCSLGAGLVMARRGAVGVLVWLVVGSLALWSGALSLLISNRFLPLAVPQVALVLTGAGCLGVRQKREASELRLMHELFDGYVGEDVLRRIKSNRPKLDGELCHVAVLFCDIRAFSTLAEGLREDPEKLMRLLNDHFEPITKSLKDHGGYVDNIVGDLMMAVFGAPDTERAADQSTRSAVLAAREVLSVVAARNREREAAGEPRIEVGVGVHCGMAVVGELGTRRKKHYTAIGDTVNIASRVEGQTRAHNTALLVTEDVVRACRDHPDTNRLEWQFIAQTSIKGRRSEVKLFSNPDLCGAVARD